MHAIVRLKQHLSRAVHKQKMARPDVGLIKGFSIATTIQTELESNTLIIAKCLVNQRESRVSRWRNSKTPINCRKWFRTESSELRPSKRGTTLGVHHLPKLTEIFTEALTIVRQRGLLGGQS
jgi:Transcriptional Coactivator p15 (PC4)